MAQSQVLKCSNCNIVINELLSFVCNKIDVMDEESLSRICVTAFTEEDISKAKSLLFVSVTTTKRRIQRKRDGKMKRDIDDIICLLKETDPELIPIFVARDLQKLPAVLFDHLDCTRLLKDLLRMQNEIQEVKEQYVTLQQLDSVKKDIANLKSTTMDVHQVKIKQGDCVLDNAEIERSVNTITSKPSKPLLDSSRVEGRQEKDVDGRSLSVIAGGGEPAVNIASSGENAMTHRITSPVSLASERINTLGHTAVTNGEHVGKKMNFASIVSKERNTPAQNKDGWTLVQKRNRINRFAGKMGKALIQSDVKFKAAEVLVPIHISNVLKGLSKEDIVTYIKEKCNLLVKVEKMSMKIEKEYDSYKVYIPKHKENIFMNDEFWPDGVSYRRFIHFRGNFKGTVEALKINTKING